MNPINSTKKDGNGGIGMLIVSKKKDSPWNIINKTIEYWDSTHSTCKSSQLVGFYLLYYFE